MQISSLTLMSTWVLQFWTVCQKMYTVFKNSSNADTPAQLQLSYHYNVSVRLVYGPNNIWSAVVLGWSLSSDKQCKGELTNYATTDGHWHYMVTLT